MSRSCARALFAACLALLVLAWPASAAPPSSSDGGLVARVSAASEAFRAATELTGSEERAAAYRRSAELFEVALADGPANGALEYNAANAWLLAGDVARAVLHYRRALLVRPADPRVLANLDTARSRRRDVFEPSSSSALLDTLFFWHGGLSIGEKVPLALSTWALGFGLLAIGAWLRVGQGGRTGCRRSGLLLIAIALAVGISAIVEIDARGARDAAVILETEVALRTGDGTSYPERYENPIHAGAEIRIVEERAGWLDVELPDGKRGWIPADSAERVSRGVP